MALKCIACSRLHHDRAPPAHHTAPGARHAPTLPHDFDAFGIIWFFPY